MSSSMSLSAFAEDSDSVMSALLVAFDGCCGRPIVVQGAVGTPCPLWRVVA